MIYNPDEYRSDIPVTLSYVDSGGEPRSTVYQINPKHRSLNKYKSHWTITPKEEVHLFGWAWEKEYFDKKYYWGVYFRDGCCQVLGKTVSGQTTRLARFESSLRPVIWHGYPVDYCSDPQNDCPRKALLTKWAADGIIHKHQIVKLLSGKGWKD